jgi:ATP-binding cassette subfamily F protein 3
MISISNGTKLQGQRVLFQNASFQINPGDKVGLVGPNGAGKTTLFRILIGEDPLDQGEVSTGQRSIIGYFSQDVGEMAGRSALEEVKAGAGKVSVLAKQIDEMEQKLNDSGTNPLSDDDMAVLLEKYGDAQMEFQNLGGYDLDSRAKEILTGLGIGPGDYEMPVESFSGGWKMRIALARILVLNPDILLMDEPTNHLDIESILWLEAWMRSYKGAMLMTSHDREFMNGIVSRIFEIGNRTLTVYTGNYDFYIKEREVRREQLFAAHKRQQDMLAKEEEFIARFAARASHAAQVQSRVKKIDKIERIELPPETKTISFEFAVPPRSGNDVVKITDLAKVWVRDDGVEKPVFHGISGMVRRLDKIAVTGVNGAGKSTLLKIITGQTEATSGSAVIGANVNIGYFSQHSVDILNPKNTVIDEMISHLPQASMGFIRNLLGAFLFSGDDVDKKISVLSGGEKSRLVIALILARPVNLLVLDEPTNHLDIESRAVLLKAIQTFEGTVMVVSHDRFFLRAIVNRVFEIDHGAMSDYQGTYDYYLSKRAAHLT